VGVFYKGKIKYNNDSHKSKRNNKWKGWGNWLGTGNICNHIVNKKDFLSFYKTRKFVRSLKLTNTKDWQKFIKNKSNILKIPSHPMEIYKTEWIDMGDWLGTGVKAHCYRKYKVNHNFFKKWSHNMAYVFGLWFADGSIVKTKTGGRVFDITLHKNDRHSLENVLKAMKSNYPVRKNRNCCFIQINSKTIVKDIIKIGGKYRKSLDCNFPYVPKKYLPDFIRGEFDGDGSIYFLINKKRYGTSFASGSISFVKKLHKILKIETPSLNGSISGLKYKKTNAAYNLNFGAYDTIRLKNFMYKNNPKLKMIRKWELFKNANKIKLLFRDKSNPFWTYKKARNFVIKLKIKSFNDWRKYCSSGKKPENIPVCPEKVYKENWESYTQWLGNKKFEFQR